MDPEAKHQERIPVAAGWVVFLISSFLILLLYWKVLQEPFVQDDWFALDFFNRNSFLRVVQSAFSPAGKVLYRPLGTVYLLGLYLLFGLAPVPFHIFGLALHLGNSILVILIIRQLTNRDMLAVVTGLLYAVAATVHIEPLLWYVGFFDLGGVFFSLLSLYLFMKERLLLSVASFVLAVLIKESGIVTLGIIFLYGVVVKRQKAGRIVPYVVVSAAYFPMKLLGVSPLSLSVDDPYRAQLLGRHLLANLSFFGQWALEAALPLGTWLPAFTEAVAAIVLALLLLRKLWIMRSTRLPMLGVGIFLVGWTILGILPVVFLTNHCSKYYINGSLIPFLALSVLTFHFIIPDRLRRFESLFLMLAVGFVTLSHWVLLERQFGNPADKVRISNGTNNLIQKAAVVRTIHTELLRQFPRLGDSSTVIINEADIETMGGAIAPRLWYKNNTLEVMNQQRYDSLVSADRSYRSRPVAFLKLPARFDTSREER